ncbi:E3 ubiquitin-protein ligase MARCHF6 [Orycteropus afer afer]|uniref:E3 ubiquitin-protein ligase MARCHF6 n=1 Tax=Orycteropus afer afer TaxID=1230840 RepID=A0A8B7B2N9_ORYAF|nr:E3 ubiquitin-protein ligase MARCHF6 [Orycteropus afer afer]
MSRSRLGFLVHRGSAGATTGARRHGIPGRLRLSPALGAQARQRGCAARELAARGSAPWCLIAARACAGHICRVCRSEGTPEKPLYHPCVCTGSIKFIHQECLVQWLKHSRKEYCELCKHRFAFTPIYSPDMPSRLPIQDIFAGLVTSIGTAIRYWFHYTLVAFAWLGVVPLTALTVWTPAVQSPPGSPIPVPENLLADCLQGCFVVTCTLCAFISLVWLREQIVHGGAPIWLEHAAPPFNAAGHHQHEVPAGGNGADNAAPEQPANPPAENAVVGENPDAQDDQAEEEEDNEEEDDAGVEDAADANNGAPDDMNWNALEWDRAAEELTWERMLGLDGSLVFLEHVFWVVSLNTLFILVFAFCPYHIGHFSLVGLGFEEHVQASHFEGLITTIVGYILLAVTLIVCHLTVTLSPHSVAALMALCPPQVSLLVVVEIGVFPLICGWWLDICSLEMFDATLKDRELSFQSAPGTTMFLHWLVGMVYVFYFASFILLLREALGCALCCALRQALGYRDRKDTIPPPSMSLCAPGSAPTAERPLVSTGVTAEMQNLVQRRIYPFLLMVVVLMGILSFQVRQFRRLYEHIKNDKYLVGQRLVNYERKSGKPGSSPPPPPLSQE